MDSLGISVSKQRYKQSNDTTSDLKMDQISQQLGSYNMMRVVILGLYTCMINGQSLQTPIQMVSITSRIVQQPSTVEFTLTFVLKRSLFKLQSRLPVIGVTIYYLLDCLHEMSVNFCVDFRFRRYSGLG